jgi:ketosteroid isomerase-like protein
VLAENQSPVKASPAAAKFVEGFAEAWGRSDVDMLLALLTEDIVLIQPLMAPVEGKAAARDSFARLFKLLPDLRAEVHRWAADGDLVFIEFTLEGTFGGRRVSWPAVDRFFLQDGLARERVSYFDPGPLLIHTLRRPRGWRRLVSSGFRPSFRASTWRPDHAT